MYAIPCDLAHDRPIGNGRNARFVAVLPDFSILATIRPFQVAAYSRQIDLPIHDPPGCAAKGCALDLVFIADESDACLGHNNACGMADVNIPVSYTHLTLPTNREV